jgi:hypothetical protein
MGSPDGMRPLEDLGIGERIILKYILKTGRGNTV